MSHDRAETFEELVEKIRIAERELGLLPRDDDLSPLADDQEDRSEPGDEEVLPETLEDMDEDLADTSSKSEPLILDDPVLDVEPVNLSRQIAFDDFEFELLREDQERDREPVKDRKARSNQHNKR